MALVIRVREGEKAKALAREVKRQATVIHCSGCGRRDFGLVEQPDAGYRTVLERLDVTYQRYRKEAISQPLVTLICTNCGHVEQFSEAVLKGAPPTAYGEDVNE
jgi:RNase P subunit RPR2